MPTLYSPPFGQSSGQVTTYTDNTQYPNPGTNGNVNTPAGFQWQFAPAAQAAIAGQFPSPLQQLTPTNIKLGFWASSNQPAAPAGLSIGISVFGNILTVAIPASAFSASAQAVIWGEAQVGLSPTQNMAAFIRVGANSVTAVTDAFTLANFATPLASTPVIAPGGSIFWVCNWGSVNTATFITVYNTIEIQNPTT